MIVFFSGTGNSRYAAGLLAHSLGDDLMDAGASLKANQKAVLHSDRPWVFVSPTYAWRLPHLFTDWLRTGTFTGAKAAYFVMTCGDDIGAAGTELAKLCAEKGFDYRGVLPVVMPENYIVLYPTPAAEEAKKLVAAARPVLEAGITAIRRDRAFSPVQTSWTDHLKTRLVNPLFYRFLVTAKPFYVTAACVSCGKCAQVCPLNNIHLSDGKPQWGDRCTHCMACICVCPTAAIEYGKKSRGKPRYWCEEYRD